MPLPVEHAPWPPPALAPALERFATHDAWWSGDPDQLRAQYEVAGGFLNRPAQHAGGVVGAVARMWWGRPRGQNEPDAKLHVPLPGDVAQCYADLLFSEPVVITSEQDATTARLRKLLDEGMHARLLEAAELVGALGGGYLRPMHDTAISDRPWIDAVPPDAAAPEWSGGRLGAVNFWRRTHTEQDGEVVFRHVERHEPEWIVHRLYQGSRDRIGRMVDLGAAESTAPLMAQVNSEGAIDTAFKGLTTVYIPRIRPSRRWRRMPALAPMGRSLFDGAEPLFDALDEVYSSWMRDIRLAKGRVFAADSVLDPLGRGKGSSFDPEREVFAVVPGAMGRDESLTIVQFAIRVEEHRETARELVNTILRRVGLNGATLGEPGEGGAAMTAREVASKERRSMITRERSVRYWKPELDHLAGALLATDKRVFSTQVDPYADRSVIFADSVSEGTAELAGTIEVLSRASAISTELKVKMLHPEWSPQEIAHEVAAIRADAGPVLDVPFDEPDEPGADGAESTT